VIDYLLTPDGDLSIVNGNVVLIYDHDLAIQKTYLMLKLQMGDFFYNTSAGIPWLQLMQMTKEFIVPFLMLYIYKIKGINKIDDLQITTNADRTFNIWGTLTDVFGQNISLLNTKGTKNAI
jgi:outer membrane lipoprotein-sorting protein